MDLEVGDRLAAHLSTEGARRLADVFVFPVLGADRRQWCFHPVTTTVTSGGSAQDCYVRAVAVPFDIVPLRPTDGLRDGTYFSVGPGLDDDGAVQPTVLLMQTEGPEPAARAQELLTPFADLLADRVEHTGDTPRRTDRRHCLAAIVRDP